MKIGQYLFQSQSIFLNYEPTSHSVQLILITPGLQIQSWLNASCRALVSAWLLPQVMPDIKVQPRRPVEEANKRRERRCNVHPVLSFCFLGYVGLCSLGCDALKWFFRSGIPGRHPCRLLKSLRRLKRTMFCRLAGESCHVAGWCIGWHLNRWNQMSMKESRLPHWSCHLVQALLLLQERRFTLFPTEKKPKDKLDISGAKEFMQIHFALRFLGCKDFPRSCWSNNNNSFLLPAWQTCSANLALSKHTAINCIDFGPRVFAHGDWVQASSISICCTLLGSMDVGEQCCAWAPCGSKALVPVEHHTGVLTTSWLDSVGQHCQAQWFYVVLCICYDFAMVLRWF